TELYRLIDRLRAVRMFSRVDPQAVVSLARVNAIIDKAFGEVESEGMTVIAHNGTECPHPLHKTINNYLLRQTSLLRQLGLIDRAQASPEPAPADSEGDGGDDRWDGLLKVIEGPPSKRHHDP